MVSNYAVSILLLFTVPAIIRYCIHLLILGEFINNYWYCIYHMFGYVVVLLVLPIRILCHIRYTWTIFLNEINKHINNDDFDLRLIGHRRHFNLNFFVGHHKSS